MEKTATKSANAPVFSLRRKGVSVSVFENQSGEGKTFFKTSLQRTYKEGQEFKTTTSFSRDDLPVAQMLMGKAYEFILDAESRDNSDDGAKNGSSKPSKGKTRDDGLADLRRDRPEDFQP